MVWEAVVWACKWHIERSVHACSSQWRQILLCPPLQWLSLALGLAKGGGCMSNGWHLQLHVDQPFRQTDRQTLRGKPSWCEISTMASPRRSKVTSMMTRFLLQASPGLRGRHVFLIEPQWSKGSLILISGDRNPIFRGDSWESGSPRVREMTVSL